MGRLEQACCSSGKESAGWSGLQACECAVSGLVEVQDVPTWL